MNFNVAAPGALAGEHEFMDLQALRSAVREQLPRRNRSRMAAAAVRCLHPPPRRRGITNPPPMPVVLLARHTSSAASCALKRMPLEWPGKT